MLDFKKIFLYARLQTVKGFIRVTGNSSKKHMCNDIVDFSDLKFFNITMRCRKEISLIQVIWKFLHINWVKVNTMVLLEGVWVYRHVQVVASAGIFSL